MANAEHIDRLGHILFRRHGVPHDGIGIILLNSGAVRHLKKGTNVLAAYGNVEYDKKSHEPRGQMDLLIEGLKISDLK